MDADLFDMAYHDRFRLPCILLGLALLAPGCTDPSGDLDTGDATESADGTGGADPADGSGNVDEGTGSGGADQGEG